MCELALVNNIHLFCLPPHTTHRLQPLDVGVFGPLQNAWQKECQEVLAKTGKEVVLKNIVRVYMDVRQKAFKKETIFAAWRKAGIRLLNPNIFTDADFAPSHTTSTHLHTPSSYPENTPGFFDDPSSDDSSYHPDKELDNSNSQSDSSSESSSSNLNMELALLQGQDHSGGM